MLNIWIKTNKQSLTFKLKSKNKDWHQLKHFVYILRHQQDIVWGFFCLLQVCSFLFVVDLLSDKKLDSS